MTQRGHVVGIPPNQDGLGDLGGVLDRLGRDEVADVIPVDTFGGGTETSTSCGIASTAP
jgi:hypothetical protein